MSLLHQNILPSKIQPKTIRLDASTYCQLKCPCCPTASGKIKSSLGSGFLEFNNFKNLIEANPSIMEIEWSNWGEVFLNPQLILMMEYAYKKNIRLTVGNGANLNTVTPEVLEALVKYKLRYITCSIDGVSQKTYQQYRVGGNIEQVINNINLINYYKKIYNSEYPVLYWQFIAFGHNEHEIGSAKIMAESLNMKFWVKLSYNERFSPVKNNELVRSHTKSGVSSCREYARKYRNRYMQKMICSQLWKKPQINWDGRVLGCCVNHWGDFGNAFESNLNDCLNGDKMNQARQLLLGKMDKRRSILYSAICRAFGKMHFSCIVLLKAALISPKCGGPEGIPCKECSYYKTMQQTGNWLTMEDATNERLIDTPDVLMSLL